MSIASSLPVAASHKRAVLSSLPVSTKRPSREKATDAQLRHELESFLGELPSPANAGRTATPMAKFRASLFYMAHRLPVPGAPQIRCQVRVEYTTHFSGATEFAELAGSTRATR